MMLEVPPSGGIGTFVVPHLCGIFRSHTFRINAVLRTRIKVTALDGVKRVVVQYGSHARVLAPEELCNEIREELQRCLRMYEKRKDKQHRCVNRTKTIATFFKTA